jgi:hypothetical protein
LNQQIEQKQANMNSVMILVKDKTVFIHFGEILNKGKLNIFDTLGHPVFNREFAKSNYEVISFEQPGGKYWLSIESDNLKTRKSFHLK